MITTFIGATVESLESVREEKKIRRTGELFLLFSFGSQFDHLIKLSLDSLGVFCLLADPSKVSAADVACLDPTGIILSGGPASMHSEPPEFDSGILELGIPTLGICLGFQLWAKHLGCIVTPGEKREFGPHKLEILEFTHPLFEGCGHGGMVLQNHGDRVEASDKITVLASTENSPVAAACYDHLVGVQYHPEVTATDDGQRMLENFCFKIAGAKDRFPAVNVAGQKIMQLRNRIGTGKVLLALSGGSDSATVAYLLKEALRERPGQVRGVYIKGVDRPDDERHVMEYFGTQSWLDLVISYATDEFLTALAGKTTMAEKRAAMSGVYTEILNQEALEFNANFICQGTLYTDLVESGLGHQTGARRAQIKRHHNTRNDFVLPELTPLDDCVKDTGRNIGRAIGVPEALLVRHPFPGPGLILRIVGEVTRRKLEIARQLDRIYIEELRRWNLYETVWQAGVTTTETEHSCVKGDDMDSGIIVVFWAEWSVNGFTSQWARLPHDFVDYVSQRFTNEVREVGSVDYRVSNKPPRTIEFG